MSEQPGAVPPMALSVSASATVIHADGTTDEDEE